MKDLGTRFGEFNSEGAIKEDVTECALSGKPVKGIHSARYRIAGTPYFYRVLTDVAHLFTEEKRAELEAAVVPPKAAKIVKETKSEAVENGKL